jgi:hypothetical protein
MTVKADPFIAYRASTSAYTAATAADGRGLTLTATDDLAQFHFIADRVVEIANRNHWRVTRLHRVGPNIETLRVEPHR